MRRLSVLSIIGAVVFAAACGSSTAPSNLKDPDLLITNNLDHDWVFITWQDGNAVIGRDSVAPRTANKCVRFLAQPDSAKWVITASENGQLASVGGVFFNPTDRPAWRVDVSSLGPFSSPAIRALDIDPALAC